MNIIRYIIHRPIAVTMIVTAIIVLGLFSILKVPISLLPDSDVPHIVIQIHQKGMPAQQIEKSILSPLRAQLTQISGLVDMQSEARMDAASIDLFFSHKNNIDLSLIEVNEKIDMAMSQLPSKTERPKAMKISVADIPAFFIQLSLKNPDATVSNFAQLSSFAENVIRKRLEQLPQTAMIDISGTTRQEIVITPDYEKLYSLGITTAHIEQALNDNSITLTALTIANGRNRYNIHFDSQLLTEEDLRNILIKHEGRILKLEELCSVTQNETIRYGWVRHNGSDAVIMAVIKQSNARMNELEVAVKEIVSQLEQDYPDIVFSISRDQTHLLSFVFNNLKENLIAGCLLTCLVLMLFMRHKRLALVVAMTIPLTLVTTLLLFYVIGISLNIISISGLILGVGMIVDNTVIVIDNIGLKRRTGKSMADAVCLGASEVFTPMLSSVLTSCSVFIPLVLISGIAGKLFFDMAMGISASLLVSLVVAEIVVPTVYFRIIDNNKEAKKRIKDGGHRAAIGYRTYNLYNRCFCTIMRHQSFVVTTLALSLPLLVILFVVIEKTPVPSLSHTDAQMTINWNEGLTEQESDRRISHIVGETEKHIKASTTITGVQQFMLPHTDNITADEAIAYIECDNADALKKAKQHLQELCRKNYSKASVNFAPISTPFDMILNTKEPVLQIRFRRVDGERISVDKATELTQILQKKFPDTYIPNVETTENLLYATDAGKMSAYSMTYASVLKKLQETTGKNRHGEISHGEQTVPVIIGTDNATLSQLMSVTIRNQDNTEIPLTYLLNDTLIYDYKRLCSSVQGPFFPINISTTTNQAEQIMQYVDNVLVNDRMLTAEYCGCYFTGKELVNELIVVLIVALTLLYLILAAQFESLVQPFIILSEMTINIAIVLAVLLVSGLSLNMMSMIGLIIMSGIVINDSILKIDTINRKRKEGMSLLHAIVSGSHERLRPIIMTSATTIFGVMPFLTQGDIGSELQFPLSVTIIVGMAVGTAVSVFFVPTLYYIIYNRRKPSLGLWYSIISVRKRL